MNRWGTKGSIQRGMNAKGKAEKLRPTLAISIILDQSKGQREISLLLLFSESSLNPFICLCHHKITDGTEKNATLQMGKNG